MASYDENKEVLKMRKPVYGLKDAPRAWKTRLDAVLRKAGLRCLHTDRSLWICYDSNKAVKLILSTHVDDLKGCGVPAVCDWLKNILVAEFGKMTEHYDSFLHCGIQYRRHEDGSITMDQNHYAQLLIPMDSVKLANMAPSDLLDEFGKGQFMSLLGGCSWMTQTRLDVAVYIAALQRAAKAPRQEHAVRLNKVVKWMKRKKAQLTYLKLTPPLRTAVISDSAFRKEDRAGLAMRGAIIGLCEITTTPGGKFHILEFYARKQRRVTTSTYSAELNGFADAYEFGKLVAMTVTECIMPIMNAIELTTMEETGTFPVPLEVSIDARSVFDSLKADELKNPTQVSLIMLLSAMKEALLCHTLKRLHWIDTKDMAADGLNKGACSRQGLLDIANKGIWELNYPFMTHEEVQYRPIESVKAMVAELQKT